MFDTLTLDDLYNLHSTLCQQHDANHQKMIRDGKAAMSVYSDEWAILMESQREINETAEAVHAEIKIRQRETRTDA